MELPMSTMIKINPFPIFLLLSHSSTLLLVAAQTGFLSIDCGLPDVSNYTSDIGLYYVSDNEFIDSGVTKQIDAALKDCPRMYQTLRYFLDYQRNCYTLPAEQGTRYLVRAYFMHGKYDGASINDKFSFDLYLGVDFWETIKLDNATHMHWTEFGGQANTTTMNVCLVKTTAAVPFISALELRPLTGHLLYDNYLYYNNTASASFTTFMRVNVGATAEECLIFRYPDHACDRIWRPDYSSYGTPISTNATVKEERETFFCLPSAVMQTTANSAGSIVVQWPGWSDARYHLVMHFADLLKMNGTRNLTIKKNGDSWYDEFSPDYLNNQSVFTTEPLLEGSYSFSVEANSGSNYGPILNAFEVFKVVQRSGSATQSQDVDAINGIKDFYGIKRNWKADPCLPQNSPWDGLTCSYENSSAARIVSLDLSNSGLGGRISNLLSQLTALRKLNLSRNNLDGPIPTFLQELPSLTNLDLSSNSLSGSVPSRLQERADSSIATLKFANKNLATKVETVGRREIIIAKAVVATLVALISLSSAFIMMKKKMKKKSAAG